MKNDGGPAFPFAPVRACDDRQNASGMSLRDAFAIAALPQSMSIMDVFAKKRHVILEPSEVAKTAYMYADAMLAERDK